MAKLTIKFIVPVERYDLEDYDRRHGPIFHRWLPDGEKDAVTVKSNSRNLNIKLWFERCGYIENGWVRFDYKKREIDPKILYRQAKVDAGPLRGKIEIKGLKEEEVQTIVDNKINDKKYVKIGKRVTKIINEYIIPFINTLRYHYGQYWIRELHSWNSKKESLGNYLKHLYMKWSTDDGTIWQDFIPNKIESRTAIIILNLLCKPSL